LGIEHETLECAGGRTFDRTTNLPVLQAADGSLINPMNMQLPKGLLPGESMTMRIELDGGTDDGALQRAHGPGGLSGLIGPLTGALVNAGQWRAPDRAAECLVLDTSDPSFTVLQVVDYGDVKIIRDAAGNCAPSFLPFQNNQFLTVPRRNWTFTDILDARDDYLPAELPTPQAGAFSFLDFGDLTPGELNFFEILRGYGEHGATLDPSCQPGGSREGTCGGEAYVPMAEFYARDGTRLVRIDLVGTYGAADYSGEPIIGATIDTQGQTSCGGNQPVFCKTTDPFVVPGNVNPGPMIGATAEAVFSDVEVIADDKTTIENEGGRAGGNKVRFTVTVANTSPAGSNIYLTSFNFQTKRRGLTDINDALDGSSIQGRQDLRLGADGTLEVCGSDPAQARCFDSALGIGRFPNVLGNSLLSATAVSGLETGRLESIKKNGTFKPLMKVDNSAANFICLKSGAPADDQDADETCFGMPGMGLLPGESQSVRLELDYGDFRGLILRVAPGTLFQQSAPFGLLPLGGDFDCRDQRRLPFCHPDLVGQDWFTTPTTLEDIEFLTVHQPGDAPTVMDYTNNFGAILAMAGFIPTAEFYQGETQVQVKGIYESLPGNRVPVASFTVSCTDLTCSFDASGSSDADGTISSYAWNFGDGNTASGATASHTYSADGTYGVALTVTDDLGATGTASQNVAVGTAADNSPPAASLTVSCTELTCEFDASSSSDSDGSIVSYAWDFGNGNSSTGAVVNHTYGADGTYVVTLTVTDNLGATGVTSRNVTVAATPPPPEPGEGMFTTTGCTNFVCYFDASAISVGSPIVSYSWSFGDGTTGSGVAASRLYGTDPVPANFSQTFPVVLTATTGSGAAYTFSSEALVTNVSGSSSLFDLGNIHPNGRNNNTNGVQTTYWTSAFTNENYTVRNTVRVHVRWSTNVGAKGFVGVRPRADAFSPGGVTGTAPRVVQSGPDYAVFEFEFTALNRPGRRPEAKGNAQFWVDVRTDSNGDGTLDSSASLGVNVHVIQRF